ncbi:MAG: DUF1801 domain-containing protein [Anaerolineae bacterium]|nr:DUF1801 domain-containing protein [Anaerolineae bacterium]
MDAEVKTYIESATDDRRALYDKLHEIILKQYPKAELVISYSIPTYKAKTGHVCLAYWNRASPSAATTTRTWPNSKCNTQRSNLAR